MDIERSSFARPVSEMEMRRALEGQSVVCTVAERSGSVAGWAVHSYGESTIRLQALAVAPHARRLGVGRLLAGRVLRGLQIGRWTRVDAVADEDNLTGLLFMRATGFRAVPDHRGRWTNDRGTILLSYEARASAPDDRGEVGGADAGTGCEGEASNFAVE